MVNGSVMAGQIAGMVKELRPVEEIITTMFAEAETLLKGRAGEVIR